MNSIDTQHAELVKNLINCAPDSERASELRAMIRRLEIVKPSLERQRIESMRVKLTSQEPASC